MNELQDKAMRKTGDLMNTDVPAKHVQALQQYINSLSNEECEIYVQIAQDLYDRKTIRRGGSRVSTNAVKLCIKLAQHGYKTFPYIEKIATKGWSVADGIYSFSMKLLESPARDIFSFGHIGELVKKDAKLDIYFNEHSRCLEVDTP